MEAAPCFDRPSDWQLVISLDEPVAGLFAPWERCLLERAGRHERRFDDTLAGHQLREQLHQQRATSIKPRSRFVNTRVY
ncbi:hypothetical protein D3C81_718110 [compost metagenome]